MTVVPQAPPLTCPSCRAVLVANHRWRGVCTACGWRSWPRALRRVDAPDEPLAAQRLVSTARGWVWLSAAGVLWAFVPQEGWRAFPLPGPWVLNGLTALPHGLVLAPGEPRPLGDRKPLLALDLESRRVLWRTPARALEWTPPASDGQRVVAVNSLGQVWALHATSGKVAWPQLPQVSWPFRGIGPVFFHDLVLVVDDQGRLHGLARQDGSPRKHWALALEHPPLVHGDALWLPARDGGLYRLPSPETRAERLFQAPRRSSRGWFFGTPLATSRGLLVRHARQPGYALSLLDPSTGQVLWERPWERHPYCPPAVLEPWVLMPDRQGGLRVLHLEDGREVDRLPLPWPQPQDGPVVVGEDVYLLGPEGELWHLGLEFTAADLPLTPEEALQQGLNAWAALGLALRGHLQEGLRLLEEQPPTPEAVEEAAVPSAPQGAPIQVHIEGDVRDSIIVIGEGNIVRQHVRETPPRETPPSSGDESPSSSEDRTSPAQNDAERDPEG